MTAVSPATKVARHEQIAGILERLQVRSQEELAALLAARGVRVGQATLSCDLEEIAAVRLRGPGGALFYALPTGPGGPGSRPGGVGSAEAEGAFTGPLPRVAAELLVSAEASANLVVLRTPAGGAQLLASALDHAGWPAILGTVAGDDTVLVITRDPAGGAEVAAALLRQVERKAAEERRF